MKIEYESDMEIAVNRKLIRLFVLSYFLSVVFNWLIRNVFPNCVRLNSESEMFSSMYGSAIMAYIQSAPEIVTTNDY